MKNGYIWLDDIRPNLCTFEFWCKSVNEAKRMTEWMIYEGYSSIVFDLDHDLGDWNEDGGDGIQLVNWLVEKYHDSSVEFIFHFHSMNPVGVQNMRNAIKKYWREI